MGFMFPIIPPSAPAQHHTDIPRQTPHMYIYIYIYIFSRLRRLRRLIALVGFVSRLSSLVGFVSRLSSLVGFR